MDFPVTSLVSKEEILNFDREYRMMEWIVRSVHGSNGSRLEPNMPMLHREMYTVSKTAR